MSFGFLKYVTICEQPAVRTCLTVTIVPMQNDMGLLSWYSTEISTTNGWCPLEIAKFSEGLYDAPQGPVIGGPENILLEIIAKNNSH